MPESKGLKARGKPARLASLQKSFTMNVSSGFTLLELLISIAILSIIMIGLHQVMGTALSAHRQTTEKTELLAQARYAMERVVMFVQETDQIEVPSADKLVVSERLLDTYNNETHTYAAQPDGYLDADNDHNGLVNEGTLEDPPDPLTFDLDKTDANNWKLMEQMPDYGSPELGDSKEKKVLCEHVTAFQCTLL
ncbi:MAG: prepilin-type N-terminal cleavage/methylation domain-containing protein, partial [Deltaproteobacteria bacterium]